ncbi:sodium:calcium antiporter [Amylibacter sp. IMCC11727]|uniref:sodium:calcium antiporter n=1 Tax=Amylibacter sp. IMCC11727 TaxID=3039851 RepID=UPI00244E1E90|nr:sodium:calcium antiporter [Amylibacter sp. IMCC11727]WGI23425.1 sodium:calcium antiporter [Amylibacter sp. IMCC11727]
MSDSILFLAIALPICLGIVVVSAGFFVKGAVAIAHRLSVPEFIVGSVIVAVGTSAPEVAINVSAVLGEAGDIVISNIIGSNIVNVGLGIGIAGMLMRFEKARPEYTKTVILGLFGAIALLINTFVTTNLSLASVSAPFAWGLLAAFAYFMYRTLTTSDGEDDEDFDVNTPLALAILLVVGGAAAMAFFSDLAVEYAVNLSQFIGIPEAVIGATVIAAGGSLPEVSSCIAAARIKRPNLILGNIAGSQIFNILGILGLSGVISSFTYRGYLWVDIAILIAMTLILLLCMTRPGPRRFKGPLLVASYSAYAAYLIIIAL